VPIPLIPATAIKPTGLDVSGDRPDENNVVAVAIHGMIALVESARLGRVPAAPSVLRVNGGQAWRASLPW